MTAPSPPIGGVYQLCTSYINYMTNSLKSRVLVRGNSTWRITRFSDQLFIAKNGFGKQHTFRCDSEVISFEDYLTKQGYALREAGRGSAIVRKTPEAVNA